MDACFQEECHQCTIHAYSTCFAIRYLDLDQVSLSASETGNPANFVRLKHSLQTLTSVSVWFAFRVRLHRHRIYIINSFILLLLVPARSCLIARKVSYQVVLKYLQHPYIHFSSTYILCNALVANQLLYLTLARQSQSTPTHILHINLEAPSRCIHSN